jgi:hypothetical protein
MLKVLNYILRVSLLLVVLVEQNQEHQLILCPVSEPSDLEKSVPLVGRVFLRNFLDRHSLLELVIQVPISSGVLQKLDKNDSSSFVDHFCLVHHPDLY